MISTVNRETWGSRAAFLLSGMGFAIGFGNIWRFPYLVGENGGAVFIAFFLVVVAVIAIPAFAIELALGKATRKDPVGAYKSVAGRTPWFFNGYLNLITILVILGYGSMIAGWIVAYAYKTMTGVFTGMPTPEIATYFETFTQRPLEVLLWMAPYMVLLAVVVGKGLQKGIERANQILIPGLFILLLVLLVRALTLPNIGEGLKFYLMPDFSKFTTEAALVAIGQAFFSIGVAMATGLVYGSYMNQEDDVVPAAVAIGFADTLAAVLAGLVIFPCVFSFGLEPGTGPGLTFVTMSAAFANMSYGRTFGFLFYVLFFAAAFSSFIGAAEGVVAHLKDEWGFSRIKATALVVTVATTIAIASALSGAVFDALDLFSTYTLVIGGLLMTVFVGWFWPFQKFLDEARIGPGVLRTLWIIDIKFVVPLVIVVLLLRQIGVL